MRRKLKLDFHFFFHFFVVFVCATPVLDTLIDTLRNFSFFSLFYGFVDIARRTYLLLRAIILMCKISETRTVLNNFVQWFVFNMNEEK